MQIPSYPKVFSLGHKAIGGIFNNEVVVQEKLDGSQFSFANIEGKFLARSRGAPIGQGGNVANMFKKAWDIAHAIFETGTLTEGMIVRAEAFDKPKHNTLAYSRVPAGNFIIFDIGRVGEHYLPWDEVQKLAALWHIETVPHFYTGKINSLKELEGFLERESVLGGVKIEGVVVKNYYRFSEDGHAMMGKYVSEAFKEVHRKDWKGRNPGGRDRIQNIITQLKTNARWEKAVQHLRDSGTLLGEPKDIGNLIQEVKKDILEEEREWLEKRIFQDFLGDVLRGVTAGLPEWYKAKLAESAFEEGKDERPTETPNGS